MQLVGQAPVEGELLQHARATRAVANTEDGTVEIQDNLLRGFELIVVALRTKFFGCIMKCLECESWGAVFTPRRTEMLPSRFLDGEGRYAQAVPLGIKEGEQRGAQMIASILRFRIMGVLFADGTLPQSELCLDEPVGIRLIGAEAIPDEILELLGQGELYAETCEVGQFAFGPIGLGEFDAAIGIRFPFGGDEDAALGILIALDIFGNLCACRFVKLVFGPFLGYPVAEHLVVVQWGTPYLQPCVALDEVEERIGAETARWFELLGHHLRTLIDGNLRTVDFVARFGPWGGIAETDAEVQTDIVGKGFLDVGVCEEWDRERHGIAWLDIFEKIYHARRAEGLSILDILIGDIVVVERGVVIEIDDGERGEGRSR